MTKLEELASELGFIKLTRDPRSTGGTAWVKAGEITDVAIDADVVGAVWVSLSSGSGFFVTETPEQVLQAISEAY